ncbi:ubiquitin-associated (UBA)/TS-N domain-containing protein [Actinidia rufa]|uniref:Ubiquitin-associated (UBA)/TS-N domain-containing protein n=1 Tax=Actinidia rufa TaxID=165716 RepID=A0A7J0GMI3_9ERIC|nr:ubiquitin-associated (UBA)/TS-N domain-containing protein [Actinidia rufa]
MGTWFQVKYGESLRRFNALINEAGQLDLDMHRLREKVLVTLVDEEDLRDVMSQSLNPMRITVKLNAEKNGRSYTRSSGSSTPMRLPRVQPSLPNLDIIFPELLKYVPERYHDTASKLCQEIASKGSSSLPVIAELVDYFSKLGESPINPLSAIQAGAEPGTHSAASGSAMAASVDKEPASKDAGATSEVMANANEDTTLKTNQKVDLEAPRSVEPLFIPDSSSLNLNALPGFGWINNKVASNFPASEDKEVGKSNEPRKSVSTSASASTADTLKHSTNIDSCGYANTAIPNLNLINECPFTGMQVSSDSAVHLMHDSPCIAPFKRSCNHNEEKRIMTCAVSAFSRMGNLADYIRMDRPVSYRHPYSWKGLYDPLQHPRLRSPTVPHVLRSDETKSNRPKLDSRFIYDVNIMDGTIMAPSTPFTKMWRMRNNGSIVWPEGTQLVWIGGDKLSDAHTVDLPISSYGLPVDDELNVAVDFTAPELPGRYISYWKMSSPSGQKFGATCLGSHPGILFLLDDVDDASLKESLCDSFNGLNLNLPPDSSGVTGPEMGSVKVKPMLEEDSLYEPTTNSGMVEDFVGLIVNARPLDQDLNFPINDTLLGGGVSNSATLEAPTSVSYPIIDLSEVAPVVSSHAPSPSAELPASAQGASENNDVEHTLLRELEEMGFKQWDPILEELQEMGFSDKETNRRLLKKNNGSIKRVVMDLIAGEEL